MKEVQSMKQSGGGAGRGVGVLSIVSKEQYHFDMVQLGKLDGVNSCGIALLETLAATI